MSAAMFVSQPAPDLTIDRRMDYWAPQRPQFRVVQAMISILDKVSAAGQRHTMEKVLALLGEHVRRASRAMSRRRSIAAWLRVP